MKIDFAQTLEGIDGVVLKVGEAEMTLRLAATTALLAPFEDEKQLEAQKKFERYMLATTIHRATRPIALKADDVALLKRLVGKAFSTVVVGAAWPLLDPAEKVIDRAVSDFA